jgi:acyl carrier protein
VDVQENSGGSSDWRGRIAAASAEDRDGVISLAVRDVVGAVLRVKPEGLRDDQPLTDLGLDSLMGVEIETMIEGSIGVALPPTSLMRARTIGQIATLISEHLGGSADAAKPKTEAADAPAPAVAEVDLDALSDVDLDRLLGDATDETPGRVGKVAELSETR